jgi:hypothetical protein
VLAPLNFQLGSLLWQENSLMAALSGEQWEHPMDGFHPVTKHFIIVPLISNLQIT